MLRTKLFKAFAVLILSFAILSAFISVQLIKNRVIKEAQTQLVLDLSTAQSVQNAVLREMESTLKIAAGKEVIVDACFYNKWPNQEVQNRLEKIRVALGLDFLGIVSPEGQVVVRAAPPYNTGDYRISDPAITLSLEGHPVTCMTLMSNKEIELEHEVLSEKAFIVLEDTPHARPTPKTDESRAMVMIGAVPVKQGNMIVGSLYGGIMLNRNHVLVDQIHNIVFMDKKYGNAEIGTVTIFLNDTRVATTVRLANGNRAIGTRVSKEVADRVLDNGSRWEGRAFVVSDWYLTIYDPIRDCQGKIIGMLYLGILERPFTDLIRNTIFRYAILSVFLLVVALMLAFFLSSRLTKPLLRLSEAAQKMQKGERPVPVKSDNASKETETLIQAFNEMAKNLSEREKTLEEAKLNMEEANLLLKNLNRSYMEAVGFISHELKSPLSSIMNYVYLVSEQKMGPLTDKQQKAMKNIDGNVRLIVEMVRHYLNLSRIENGELDPVFTRVIINEEVLVPLLDSFEAAAWEYNINLVNNIGNDIIVKADLNMTREIFENLIGNAIKYGREGGKISINARSEGDFVQFSVFNEGEGIPPRRMKDLFQKFSRLETDKADTKRKGTGLGLFITKTIVEAHGGSIKVESKHHEWANFIFTLPAYKDEE
ncbi:MAG: cache domain-containing protein [Deltaproteobacteria bacterium]|nr:cache domain-containing protein [Deltaproteobacteria bacterium]